VLVRHGSAGIVAQELPFSEIWLIVAIKTAVKRIRGTPILEKYTQFVQNTAITLHSIGLIQTWRLKLRRRLKFDNLQRLIDLGPETEV
jgi:hypothetical protein